MYNDKKFIFCLNLILSVVKESEGKSWGTERVVRVVPAIAIKIELKKRNQE